MTETCIQKAVNEGKITKDEAVIIEQYLSEKDAAGICASRHWKIGNHLVLLRAQVTEPYNTCQTADILAGFVRIKSAKRNPRSQEIAWIEKGLLDPETLPKLTQNSVNDKQRILKAFSLWLCESGLNPNLDTRKLQKMKPVTPTAISVEKADLLTPAELDAFFAECRTARDRALFHLMWEGGLRCSDIGNMRFKDVLITDSFCRIKTDGKTGKLRTIPIIESRKYLTEYLNDYPKVNPAPDDFIFLNRNGRPISQASVSVQMKKIAARAGIKKHIHPHLFRHGRITELTESGMKESHIKMLAWGNLSTGMMRTYSHLNEQDLERELARVGGYELPNVTAEEAVKRERRPVQCQHCGAIMPHGSKYCDKCHMPLSANAESELMSAVSLIYATLQKNPSALAGWALGQQK